MGFFIKKLLLLVVLASISYAKTAYISLEFTEDGVLRKGDDCDITFTNFGMDKWIKNINITMAESPGTDVFSLNIEGLINGNIGPNNKIYTDRDVLKKYIEIQQNKKDINDFEVTRVNKKSGIMNIRINNLLTCKGLKVKQTYIEKLVTVANRLYYGNQIPSHINQAFQTKKFGPSYSYPFERIHWKINEGLDDLRKTCGIYIYYYGNAPHTSNGLHWQYYLSVENVNTKKCDHQKFFEVIKRNYIDYHFTEELLGKNYIGYVLKREGHIEEHMDGAIVDNGYTIEMYQKNCSDSSTARSICVIPSKDNLSFSEFAGKLITDCLNITLSLDEKVEWDIKNGITTGTLKHQIISVQTTDVDSMGSLPANVKGNIKYKVISKDTTPVARFIVSFACKDGTYIDDTCQCQGIK